MEGALKGGSDWNEGDLGENPGKGDRPHPLGAVRLRSQMNLAITEQEWDRQVRMGAGGGRRGEMSCKAREEEPNGGGRCLRAQRCRKQVGSERVFGNSDRNTHDLGESSVGGRAGQNPDQSARSKWDAGARQPAPALLRRLVAGR